MKKRYAVRLSDDEHEELRRLIAAGTAPARKLTHARILLKADQGPGGPAWVDERIAEAVESSQPRVPDLATLAAEVPAWQARRNAPGGRVDWRFTTADARLELKRLYPSTQE